MSFVFICIEKERIGNDTSFKQQENPTYSLTDGPEHIDKPVLSPLLDIASLSCAG